ncbi:MAG TPA: SCO1664 family protein [Micromonosporaceae bacterium]|nr:SCO1664 family protein [Micromonosporaceae bacterium]
MVIPVADALDLLRLGDLEIEGRLVDASNTTLRAEITFDGVTARCVYKPVRGERPLWDFPDGTLAGREVGAYLVGAATGWDPVPPTVLRDGPFGPGACQLWIDEVDPDAAAAPEPLLGFAPARQVPDGWHRVAAARDDTGKPFVLAHADDQRLARLAAFDVVVNNADRKGGHILQADGHVYGVDHGVCFHTENKLRTILWGWVGDPFPGDVTEVLRKIRADLDGALGEALAEHLTVAEVAAAVERTERLLATGTYPLPSDDWPAVPWPPI